MALKEGSTVLAVLMASTVEKFLCSNPGPDIKGPSKLDGKSETLANPEGPQLGSFWGMTFCSEPFCCVVS